MGLLSRCAIAFLFLCSFTSPSVGQDNGKKRSWKYQYEEIHFEDLIQRYLEKDEGPFTEIEGVYSVSCVVVKKSPHFITRQIMEKVVARKENYARVAVLRERPGAKCDFVEVSLSYRQADKYPIMGEFNLLAEGGGLIYRHFEPQGSIMSFSMTHDGDLFEGEFSTQDGNKTITYKLSYLKIYPRNSAVSVRGAFGEEGR